MNWCKDGNPIAAMALVREETGASLRECRTYVGGLGTDFVLGDIQ
jgi:hypothetical protein